MNHHLSHPPVIVLGGGANTLSIARSLGKRAVKVYALLEKGERTRMSRYCQWIPPDISGNSQQDWLEFLTSVRAESLRGAVLLAASDEGIQLIATHREELSRRYLLDESNPHAQIAMLNKLETYQAARAAGVPTPEFWTAGSLQELEKLKPCLKFPLIIKPLYSHLFVKRLGVKLFIVDSFEDLCECYRSVEETDLDVMLVEMIPGPDDRLCSYYTYLDQQSRPQFDFTKHIIRRFPAVTGNGCSHITDWNPEVRDLSLQLFHHVGLQGLANAEFKRDERDGQLKLIECNARFTAANCLVTRSGLDLASYVYDRILGRNPQLPDTYKTGLRLWYPLEDIKCFLDLRRRGDLTLLKWLRSILHRQTLPYFAWNDPWPSLIHESARCWKFISHAATQIGISKKVHPRTEYPRATSSRAH